MEGRIQELFSLMDSTGIMQTGWEQSEGAWYYLNNDGAMTTGWQEINGAWYYLNADGSMAGDTEVYGYTFGSDGALVE